MGVLESTYKIDEKDILSNNYDILGDDYIQINDNFYYTKLLEWYNNTDFFQKWYNLERKVHFYFAN